MEQIQVQRFYETLALLIANKEGVDIKVTVTPRQDGQSGRQDGKELADGDGEEGTKLAAAAI